MLTQRTNCHVYIALILAIATAILSAEPLGGAYRQVSSLLTTDGPEASAIAGAIAEHPETIVPP